VSSEFTLRWEDQFDSLDTGRWVKMDHTFGINLARFNPNNAVTEEGYLKLRLTNDPSGDGDTYKPYAGGEVRTEEEFQYGRFDTCARWGKGFGVVGSFFTYRYQPWNEIDIEYLGFNNVGVQYNIIWNGGGSTDPQFDPLGVDLADDFHQYSIEWVPGQIRFYVDGQLRHTESEGSAQAITEPSTLRMNLWTSNDGFAGGGHDPGAIPTESWYDWVRVYDYN
jgi:beta-glucanase (GH16 family)